MAQVIFLPLQNVSDIISIMWQRIKTFHQRKVDYIKEFRPKIAIYLPVIRYDVAMVTALIPKK